jgi:hypothetical protein
MLAENWKNNNATVPLFLLERQAVIGVWTISAPIIKAAVSLS